MLPCPSGRQFLFRATMRPHLGIYKQLTETGQKPPTHFHTAQWESFKVLKGSLTIDFNGIPRHCTPGDGEVVITPRTHHVMYGTPGKELDEVEFEISGGGGEEGGLAMDLGFFENWYGYQEDVFQRGQVLDIVQVLSVWNLYSSSIRRLIESVVAREAKAFNLFIVDVRCLEYVPFAASMGTVQGLLRLLAGSHCW